MAATIAIVTRVFLFREKDLTREELIAALTMTGMAKTPAENSALGWQSDTVTNPAMLSPKEEIRPGLCRSIRNIKADSTAGTKDSPIKYVCNGPNISRPHGKA